jgi:hypothetical protein
LTFAIYGLLLIFINKYDIFLMEDSPMKQMTEILEEIDGYTIIRGFDVCPVDPEATKAAVENEIRGNHTLSGANLENLFNTHVVYSANAGPGRKLISEAEYTTRRAAFDALEEHQLLTEELEVIPDFRNTEYWQKPEGRWEKIKIVRPGVTIPADAVLPDALTEAQRMEIAAQEGLDRIAALSPAEKEAEKQARIKAVIHEAVIKKQEAELEAEVNDTPLTFDPVAWVREQKEEIEALYA